MELSEYFFIRARSFCSMENPQRCFPWHLASLMMHCCMVDGMKRKPNNSQFQRVRKATAILFFCLIIQKFCFYVNNLFNALTFISFHYIIGITMLNSSHTLTELELLDISTRCDLCSRKNARRRQKQRFN